MVQSLNETPTPTESNRKLNKLEGVKEHSNFLREPVATELREDTTHFSHDGYQILKFHGSYQQDNRDNRVKGQEKDYQFMLRTRSPAGYVPPQLYRALDRLSEEYGNHTLRTTTRQGFQMHGILKKDLKTVFREIIQNMGSTLGACGDLNRNVMAPPAPFVNRLEYDCARRYANNIADLLTPQTGAYYEIWLDGEKAISGEESPAVKEARQRNGNGTIVHDAEEPIYGQHYMPRKFKCCVTVPGDNSVDIYSQDLGLVVILDESGRLEGFNVLAGGGLGRTHNKEQTFARAADPIGFVPKDDIYDLVKAVVATQRDYGDRRDRRHARMKYLLHDWGVEKFRNTVERYFGKPLDPFRPLPAFKYQDFLGWHEQGDGKLFYGISVENGRIKDEGSFQLKTALRQIVEQFNLPMVVTPHHNLILGDISPEQQRDIEQILQHCGIQRETDIDPLVRYGMACPALPTCGLAITESERVMPSVLERIRALLIKVGLPQEHFVVRMTGCPNGCARPYLAELGLVGKTPGSYQVWLGADPHQTRLAHPYIESLQIENLEAALEPLFVYYKQERQHQVDPESFGDFCHRVGFEALRRFAATYSDSNTSASSTEMPDREPFSATSEPMHTPNPDPMQTPNPQPMSAPSSEPVQDSPPASVQPNPAPAEMVSTPPPQTEQTPPVSPSSPAPEGGTEEGQPAPTPARPPRRRINVSNEIYLQLKAEAARQGKPMSQLAGDALDTYLKNLPQSE
ncbi:sulfite reductase, ferredoxin dependent [Phormidium sp. CCY1219]|uniref:sulfite reductase, ferredoxin dependent n=1 Tax=Phormidium sp. CCY1219 TaxID=2886104 RepID=UPI002D1F549E|nr:sulfite reductase, ferredoxin dependent [Phormidium sp. CCY1219]MEB3828354.1 sulfite reductase, ferredoxin dependent [Phormidium sp. CCY1219]